MKLVWNTLVILSVLMQIAQCRPSSLCGGGPADIVFVVDSSSSIWYVNFEKNVRPFVRDVTNMFDVGSAPTQTRIGLVTFSDRYNLVFHLNTHSSKSNILHAIMNMPQIIGNTNTSDALRFVKDEMFTSKYGSRNDAAHVAIVLTDGKSQDYKQTKAAAQAAQEKGIELFAIGVGDAVDEQELADIASDPDDNFVMQVTDFDALVSIKNQLADKACNVASMKPVIVTSTTTTVTSTRSTTDTPTVTSTHTTSTSAVTSTTTTQSTTPTVSTTRTTLTTDTPAVTSTHTASTSAVTSTTTTQSTTPTVSTTRTTLTTDTPTVTSTHTASTSAVTSTTTTQSTTPTVSTTRTTLTTDTPAVTSKHTLSTSPVTSTSGTVTSTSGTVTLKPVSTTRTTLTTDTPAVTSKDTLSTSHVTSTTTTLSSTHAPITSTTRTAPMTEWATTTSTSGTVTSTSGTVASTSGTVTLKPGCSDIRLIPITCGGKPADVYFVLDSSASININEFNHEVLGFVRNVSEIFDVGEHKTRVGVMSFSDIPCPVIGLNEYSNLHKLQSAITNETIPFLAGGTNTAAAIRHTRKRSFSSEIARPDVAHVIIIITDGQSRSPIETSIEAEAAKQAGIYLFAIGVGSDVDQKELNAIASQPNEHFVFSVSDFSSLVTIKHLLAIRTCGLLPQDQPKETIIDCKLENSKVMFLFDSVTVGLSSTRFITSSLGNVMRSLAARTNQLSLGTKIQSCSSNADIPLTGRRQIAHALKTHSDSLYPRLAALMKSVRIKTLVKRGDLYNGRRVMVIVVDDVSLERGSDVIAEANRAKFNGVEVFVVTIGRVNKRIIRHMASTPHDEHIFNVLDVSHLGKVTDDITSRLCGEMEYTFKFPPLKVQ